MKAAAILGVAMSLAVGGMARADQTREPICQAGTLADAVTGAPVFCGSGPNRQPCPCDVPVVDSGINPLYAVGGVLVAGAAGTSGNNGNKEQEDRQRALLLLAASRPASAQ